MSRIVVHRGRPRTRIVLTTTSVVVALALSVGMAGTALAATNPAPLTPANLQALEASYRAQQDALKQAQVLAMARLNQAWAQKITDRNAAAVTEQAGITAQMNGATAAVNAARDAALVAVEANRQTKLQAAMAGIQATYDAKLPVKQAWVAQHTNDLKPNATPLYGTQALTVQAQMDLLLKADVAPIDAAAKNAAAPSQAQLDAAKALAATNRTAFQASQKSAASVTAGAYTAQVNAANADLVNRLAALSTKATQLTATYNATVATLTAQANSQIAAAKAARQSTTSISAALQTALTEQKALYQQQSAALSAQVTATKSAGATQLSDLKAANDAETRYQQSVNETQLKKFDDDTALTLLPLQNALDAAKAPYKVQKDDVTAIDNVKTAVALKDPVAFANALNQVVALVDRQRQDSIKAINDPAKKQSDGLTQQAADQVPLAQAPFQRRLQESAANLKSALDDLAAQQADAVAAFKNVQAQQTLLAQSDYQILKTRTQAYLASTQSATTPLDNFYDPATDAGSLYNVAKTIGVPKDNAPTGAGVKIAQIDTGVAPVDGLAQANVTLGPDFSFEDLNPDTQSVDTNGHGTHLAGIMVGSDDTWLTGDHTRAPARSLGIAPDANLVAIKAATASGTTDVSQVIAAINWVIAYNQANPTSPIRAINLAYGTDSTQDYTLDPLSFAVERAWKAGIVVVVAAGNDGWDASQLTNPGRDPFIIAVGASQGTHDQAVAAAYSSEGAAARGPDLLAPGRSVVSLRDPGSFSDTMNGPGRAGDRLVRGSGTSQATAVVTGAIALLLQQRPNLTPDQVKALLLGTANTVPNGNPALDGAGVLDIGHALEHQTIYPLPQAWTPSTGTGSLEAARGTGHVLDDQGNPLVGEQDVFGNSYAATQWATDEWTGRSWRDAGWAGRSWRVNDWTGRSWRGDDWYGRSWRTDHWEGRSWRDTSWTGRSWRTDRWTGRSWRGNAWTGNAWTDDNWAGRSWRGFGAF